MNDGPAPIVRDPLLATRPRRRLRRRGTIIAALGVVVLVGAAWFLAQHASGAGGRSAGRRPTTTVGVAAAVAGDIPITLEALGSVTPAATVTVRPQVTGVLTSVAFREGQMVRQGETLAVIDPRPFQLALAEAQGNLTRDEAQLQNAELTLARYRTLLAQDSIARQDVDTQAAAAKQLRGVVAADRAALGTARLNLAYSRIAAPVAGRVGLRVIDVGNYVAAGDAAGVAVITQVAPIDVEFAVPEDDVPQITARAAKGAPPQVAALDRARTTTLAQGAFLTLDNQVDPTTGTVKGKARFINTDGALFPSQFVNVRMLLDVLRAAVIVPSAAVRHGPKGDFVYVVGSDRAAHLRMVTRGPADGDRVSIAKGLAAGEQVVTEGGDRLTDGAKVQLPSDKPAAAGGGGRRHNRSGSQASAAG